MARFGFLPRNFGEAPTNAICHSVTVDRVAVMNTLKYNRVKECKKVKVQEHKKVKRHKTRLRMSARAQDSSSLSRYEPPGTGTTFTT